MPRGRDACRSPARRCSSSRSSPVSAPCRRSPPPCRPAPPGPLRVYLADASRDSVGAALTVLANMAASTGRPASPAVTVACRKTAMSPVSSSLRSIASRDPGRRRCVAEQRVDRPTRRRASRTDCDGVAPHVPDALEEAAAANRAQYDPRSTGLVSSRQGAAALRNRGFFFADTDPHCGVPAGERPTPC